MTASGISLEVLYKEEPFPLALHRKWSQQNSWMKAKTYTGEHILGCEDLAPGTVFPMALLMEYVSGIM